ncbi:MAG: hypothetical protein ACJ735_04515 [Actinomycetes bacterium]
MIASVLARGWDGVAPAQAGWLGLAVLLALGVAMVFLYKSMSKQLKKVPKSFDEPDETAPPADGSASAPPRRFGA